MSPPKPKSIEDTPETRESARVAAAALRAVREDPSKAGEGTRILASGRPHHWHIHHWPGLPGFQKTISFSTRAPAAGSTVTYTHDLLPGWEYALHELDELIADLDAFAAGKGQPKEASHNPPGPYQGRLL